MTFPNLTVLSRGIGDHRRRLLGAARAARAAPPIIEKRPCFHQSLPPFAPQYFGLRPRNVLQVSASVSNIRVDVTHIKSQIRLHPPLHVPLILSSSVFIFHLNQLVAAVWN